MKRLLPALLLASCAAPPDVSEQVANAIPSVLPAATAAASPDAGATASLVTVTPPRNGQVTVTGKPGAIPAAGVTQLLLGVIHDLLGFYGLLHVGNTVVVGGAKIPLPSDGSFGPLTLGDPGTPVQSGDRLLLVPQNAQNALVGETQNLFIP